MEFFAIIPARGGSKGIPGKNIKLLGGKPLIYYTIEAAREVLEDQYIIISTDDEDIKNKVEQTGIKVPFIRPQHLSGDHVGTYEVLLHSLEYLESIDKHPEVIVLLQATSPFRNGEHIREAIELYHSDVDMVVSVKETASNPYFMLFEEDDRGFLQHSKKGDFARRQDCPKVWEYNGAIYVLNVRSLKRCPISHFDKVVKYVMDEQSSLDIDSPLDWKIAELLINK
jgi:CMP-N,N'-diacetyllegionaminic acid synthase